MAELREAAYVTRKVKRTTLWKGVSIPTSTQELALDLEGGDLAVAGEACRDAEAIAQACGLASAANDTGRNKVESGVYVVGVVGQDIAKIGISHCPVERFADIQAACWTDLSLYAVAWSPTRHAGLVEQRALDAASAIGKRLRGEWVAMTAPEAFTLVLEAARDHRVPVCDSRAWLKNWNTRIAGIAHSGRMMAKYLRR